VLSNNEGLKPGILCKLHSKGIYFRKTTDFKFYREVAGDISLSIYCFFEIYWYFKITEIDPVNKDGRINTR